MLPVAFEPSCKITTPHPKKSVFSGAPMFLYIAVNVILPIFIVMALGFLVSKFFTLDLASLSKLNFYIFIPVFMFYSLLIFKPQDKEMGETILFNLLLALFTFFIMYGL